MPRRQPATGTKPTFAVNRSTMASPGLETGGGGRRDGEVIPSLSFWRATIDQDHHPRHLRRRTMPDLPAGTVTFLFTDIEGSTALWERDRQAIATAVERHL